MNRFIHFHNEETSNVSVPQTQGQVIRWPVFYEFILWVVTRGKEKAFRQFVTDLAAIQPGEIILDVGCGTGTQVLMAKEHVGESGSVFGIEPSLEMVSYARRKAARRGLSVNIQPGVIEKLDYPDQSFDVVLCVIVMHHMPDEAKILGIKEMARVIRPGGRLLVVDSDLHLLPPFEEHGFSKIKTGRMPYVGSYDYILWKMD
jgi:demethylmenaquinone methyltransferase/2-methoxy-6-polyprenyl-1,4-benzoquinol methylase/phosphoethanolamine N-methyltransferase